MKKGQKIIGSTAGAIALIVVIVIAINVISSSVFFRADITEDNLYTLSQGSKNIVSNLKYPTTVKYYFSKSSATLPIVYKNYGNKIAELLAEYEAVNPGKLIFEQFDPRPDTDEDEWARKYGVTAMPLGTGEEVFLGLVIVQEGMEKVIPVLDPRREQFLEYDISEALLGVDRKKTKVIGIMSSLPAMGKTPDTLQRLQGHPAAEKWAFISEIEKSSKIVSVEPTEMEIDASINTLIVIHPKHLSEIAQYAIDQFVMRGGDLIVMVDPNARVDEAAAAMAQMGGMGQRPQAGSNLEKLFQHWGIQYSPDKILGDKDRPSRINTGAYGVVAYSLWHTLNQEAFNKDLVATKDLDSMLLVEPGGFSLFPNSPLQLKPLIQSSINAGFIESFVTRFTPPNALNNQLKTDGKNHTIAGILSGDLTSAFDKAPESGSEDKKEKKPISAHRSKTIGKANILMITDVDFIEDRFSVEKFNILGQTMMRPRNDNLAFMVNMVDLLGGATELMKIRSRGKFQRPFTRFLELERRSQLQFQEAEGRIQEKLRAVQQKLSKLTVQEGTNKVVLSKEQINQIRQFRDEEKKTRSELKEIRKLLRKDIETEKTTLTLLNLLFVPILISIIGILLYVRRFRYKKVD